MNHEYLKGQRVSFMEKSNSYEKIGQIITWFQASYFRNGTTYVILHEKLLTKDNDIESVYHHVPFADIYFTDL